MPATPLPRRDATGPDGLDRERPAEALTALTGTSAASMGTPGTGVGSGGRTGSNVGQDDLGRAERSAAANHNRAEDPNELLPDGPQRAAQA